MSQLDLPPYIINVPFITAIRKDCLDYIDGIVKHTPCMATSLFYTVDEDKALCLFDQVLHYPIILLMTPFAYSILFESKRAIKYFAKKPGTMESHCYAADCLSSDGSWYSHYRVIEFSPALVRRPSASLYAILIEVGFGFDEQKTLKCSLYKKGKQHSVNEAVAENVWEAMWSIWRQFRNPAILLDATSELLIAGCNARKLARRVDFGKLLTLCQSTKTLYTQIIYFLQLLIFHGIDMQDTDVLANYLNVMLQLTSLEECDPRLRRNLFLAIYYLAGDCVAEYIESVETIQQMLRIKTMPREVQQSLQMRCVRRIRQASQPRGFYRNIWRSPRLNEPCKRILLMGMPDFRNTGEYDAGTLVKSTWNAKKTHFSLKAEAMENLKNIAATAHSDDSGTTGSSSAPMNSIPAASSHSSSGQTMPAENEEGDDESVRFRPELTPTSTITVRPLFENMSREDEQGVPTYRTIPNGGAPITESGTADLEFVRVGSPVEISSDLRAEAYILSENEIPASTRNRSGQSTTNSNIENNLLRK